MQPGCKGGGGLGRNLIVGWRIMTVLVEVCRKERGGFYYENDCPLYVYRICSAYYKLKYLFEIISDGLKVIACT